MDKDKLFLTVLCFFTLIFTFNAKEVLANNRGRVHGVDKLENRSSVRKRKRAENNEIVNIQNKSVADNNNRKPSKKNSNLIYNNGKK